MKKYVDFIHKYNKPLLVLFVVINLVAIFGVTKMRLNTDFALFTTNDSVYEERLAELEETFGSSNQITVMVESNEFSKDTLTELRYIQSQLEEMEHLDGVSGVAPATLFINLSLVPIEQLDVSTIETYYDSFGDFSPIKVYENTYYFIYTLIASDNFNKDDVIELESILDSVALTSYIAGDTYNQYKLVTYITGILVLLPPLAILIILAVFRFQLGGFKATFLSVLPAAIGSLWTFGIIGYMGNEVSIMTAIVPIFIIVIGSADGLHFVTHYQEARLDGNDVKISMARTLHVVGIPMIITTLTSMAGFLALLTMNTDSIFDLAVYSALGIFLAGVATWYVLPLLLSRGVNITSKHPQTNRKNLTSLLTHIWGYKAIVITSFIILFGILLTPQIKNEFDMLNVYKDYTEVSKSAAKLQEVNGGSIPLFLVYENEDVTTVDAMDEITALTDSLATLEEVTTVINPYAMIQNIFLMQTGMTITSDIQLQMIFNQFEADESIPINSMIKTEDNKVRLLLYPIDMENETLGTIENHINTNSSTTEITGIQYLLRDLNIQLNTMQTTSILLALIAVFIMLAISLNDIKTAFISIIPIVVTISAVYGVLGITGISLNITTVIIFSISIGVGIDYAVHYSSVYKLYYKETGEKKASISRAFKEVSKPVVSNAFGVSLGLSALMFSPFTIHLHVSILMWVSMIVSVFVTLTLLPTLLSFGKK